MRHSVILTLALALGSQLTGSVGAQEGLLVTRTDGSAVAGRPTGLTGSGAKAAVRIATPGGSQSIPVAEILGFHGRAPKAQGAAALTLVGGDTWVGEVLGGDDLGDFLRFRSAALGTHRVPIDRLAVLRFRARTLGADAAAFAIAEEATASEGLFRKAQRGFDLLLGALDRFAEDGVHFVASGRNAPRLFRYDSLVAVSVRGGAPSEKRLGTWLLVTAAGDRLRVGIDAVDAAGFRLRTEFGPVQLSLAGVASLVNLGDGEDRRYLSDLEPIRVEETGSADGLGREPLFSYQRDRTASGGRIADRPSPAGGALVAGDRTYGKGIGVHSRSVLTFRVPEGMTRFHTRVAMDDEVKALRVRGDVDLRIRQGDQVLFEKKGVQRGQETLSVGILTVRPGATFTLEVGFGKGMFLGDRVDWLGAVFLR